MSKARKNQVGLGKLPQVVLLGRPNVGKSTLFNRLVGQRQSIVDDQPGVTRDLHYGLVKQGKRNFEIVDTGGLIPVAAGALSLGIRRQVAKALETAALACFLVDGRLGLAPAELELAQWLREWGGPVILVVHKIDEPQHLSYIHDFYRLGFTKTLALSSETRLGLREFLDTIVTALPAEDLLENEDEITQPTEEKSLTLAIVGQPNAGKSTLLNALVGQERALVSEIAGTTLDPVFASTEYGNLQLNLIDTAGIKRRKSTQGKVEKVGVLKALASVKQSDLVLLLVDATLGFVAQDLKILSEAESSGKGILLVLNKWDLVKSGTKVKDLTIPFQERFKRQAYVPMVALSAKSGRGIKSLLEKIELLQVNYKRRVSTGELNRFLQEAIKAHPPPVVQSKAIHVTYLTQARSAPPRFVLFANHPQLVPETYLRFLERRLRKDFDFTGVPLKWLLRRKH